MVVPADRLFTREYLKSLFPNTHIEMARYSIFVLCFLSVSVVSVGAREERSCRQLNLHLMCDDDDDDLLKHANLKKCVDEVA